MKSCERLYGVKRATWMELPYQEALNQKIQLTHDLVKELNKVHWKLRDSTRINDVLKARKFNEELLKE